MLFSEASCHQFDMVDQHCPYKMGGLVLRGGEGKLVSSGHLCVVLADIMQGGGGWKVLTTGLLRVELAPEEYQLYSEGCGLEGGARQEINKKTDVRLQGTTVSCCGGDFAETLFDKYSVDLQLLNCTQSHKDRRRRK